MRRKIAVGSTNPAKIAAVQQAFERVWTDVAIVPVAVDSGVRDQPLCDDEAVRGARNRAQRGLAATGADVGVGLEAGVADTPYGMFVFAWAAVVDGQGTLGLGSSGRLLLPESVAQVIRGGGELGPVMDRFSGIDNVKYHLGAIGVFTGERITRAEALETAILYALAKFINPDYYT